jgi:ribose-phosphate pyrophosphokinase
MNNPILFCGKSSQRLGKALSLTPHAGLLLGNIDHVQFPSGEWYCQLKDNVRGEDIFLVNSITTPANDSLMQLCIMADAARRASAGRITAVIPYMGYSRQDRKDKSRVPISAKLVMDILEASGINRVVTMDLHAPQIAGFTNLPFDHLQFRPALIEALKQVEEIDAVVAPDVGAVKRSEEYASRLDVELAIISKKRKSTINVEAKHFIGDVRDQNVLIVDDLTESAGTLISAAKECKSNGAKKVYCAITHGCFTDVGNHRLCEAFRRGTIDRLFVSNTVETVIDNQWWPARAHQDTTEPVCYKDFVTYVDVAPLFASAIKSIHRNESISSLFV